VVDVLSNGELKCGFHFLPSHRKLRPFYRRGQGQPLSLTLSFGGIQWFDALVPSLIEGPRVVQGLRVVSIFLYRYSMKN